MGSSSKKRKDNPKSSRGKKPKKSSARSDLSSYRKKHPNETARMIGEVGSDSSEEIAAESGDEEIDVDSESSEDERVHAKPKSVGALSAKERLNNHVKVGAKKVVAEKRREGGGTSGTREGDQYKDDSTITSRNTDSVRTPTASRTGQVVTPATQPDAVGSSNRSLVLENTKLRRQLNGLSTVGVHEEALATAIKKYVKVTLFRKVKFVTNQARLNIYMVDVMNYFHVEEKDRLHWGSTYQHDVCDAINQKRNHVAQNLRKVFNSKCTSVW